MPQEVIKARTLEEGKKQLHEIYLMKSTDFTEITKEEYESYEQSEREDSDNHLNLERLGKDTDVVDLAYYKFLPNGYTAYHIHLIHKDGKKSAHDYFMIKPSTD